MDPEDQAANQKKLVSRGTTQRSESQAQVPLNAPGFSHFPISTAAHLDERIIANSLIERFSS
jgi:hypothetical protein